jgi:hypothetical protein
LGRSASVGREGAGPKPRGSSSQPRVAGGTGTSASTTQLLKLNSKKGSSWSRGAPGCSGPDGQALVAWKKVVRFIRRHSPAKEKHIEALFATDGAGGARKLGTDSGLLIAGLVKLGCKVVGQGRGGLGHEPIRDPKSAEHLAERRITS